MRWREQLDPCGDVHLIPRDDAIPHEMDGCACGPMTEHITDGRVIIVHQSLDGREQHEESYE